MESQISGGDFVEVFAADYADYTDSEEERRR
jgi:hypothetical protein